MLIAKRDWYDTGTIRGAQGRAPSSAMRMAGLFDLSTRSAPRVGAASPTGASAGLRVARHPLIIAAEGPLLGARTGALPAVTADAPEFRRGNGQGTQRSVSSGYARAPAALEAGAAHGLRSSILWAPKFQVVRNGELEIRVYRDFNRRIRGRRQARSARDPLERRGRGSDRVGLGGEGRPCFGRPAKPSWAVLSGRMTSGGTGGSQRHRRGTPLLADSPTTRHADGADCSGSC